MNLNNSDHDGCTVYVTSSCRVLTTYPSSFPRSTMKLLIEQPPSPKYTVSARTVCVLQIVDFEKMSSSRGVRFFQLSLQIDVDLGSVGARLSGDPGQVHPEQGWLATRPRVFHRRPRLPTRCKDVPETAGLPSTRRRTASSCDLTSSGSSSFSSHLYGVQSTSQA